MSSVKFAFKKSISSKPLNGIRSKLKDVDDDDKKVDGIEYIKSLEGTHINGRSDRKERNELVIPMIHKNHWRKERKNRGSSRVDSSTSSKTNEERRLEEQAVTEILESAKLSNENGSSESELEAIPLLLQNRIPDGFETDDKLDVSLRAEESNLDDYERIPIEQFGLALLRGMGWKKSEGIGLKNKKVVDVKEPQLRPRGLGLGAERPNQ